MLPKNQRFDDSNNVFLIFRIIGLQLLQDAGFNEPLFIQPLFISEDLQGDNLLLLVIKALEHLSEGALANTLLYFISISNVVVDVTDIFTFIVIKAAVLGPVGSCEWLATVFTLKNVKIVDLVVLQYLSLLVVKQVFAEVHDDVSRLHWELNLKRPLLIVTEEGLARDRAIRLNTAW